LIDVVFLDEATSALDEAWSTRCTSSSASGCPSAQSSASDRSTLEALHTWQLALLSEGRWQSSSLVG
jgi:ABC-type uncharacterized transport system fused permease/ATPase subunit